MDIYRIADLDIGIKTRHSFTKKYLSEYLTQSLEADFCVEATDEMIAYEKEVAVSPVSEPYYELTAILRQIVKIIAEGYDGFFLHCSCFEMDSKAYIFAAPSGTGKSTHTALWRKVFKDRITMINDDKPIVRLIDGEFYIYGTPWNGKHSISNNIKAKIGAVFFLSQAKENSIEESDAVSSVTRLLSQTILPDDNKNMLHLLDMLDKMCSDIPMFSLKCNISEDAVLTAYNAIKS